MTIEELTDTVVKGLTKIKRKGGSMAKGQEKTLLLKRKLMKTKNELLYTLVGRNAPQLSLAEKKVYQDWLQNIDEIISICEDRKRF